MKKEIYLFIDRWGSGGIESLLANIVDKIDTEKFEANILVSQKESNVFDEILEKNKCIVKKLLNKTYANPALRIIKSFLELKKFFKENNIDIIHINVYNSVGLIYAAIAKRAGIKKIIVHAHNTGIDNDKLKIKYLIHSVCQKLFVKKDYIYLACSDEAAEFCFGHKNATIIHNGIDISKFIYNQDIRNEYRKKFNLENKFVIGNVGRFVEQKNHEFLVNVFSEIVKLDSNSTLMLIGKGPLKDSIQQQVQKLNLSENVIFLEERNDVNNLMQMMDVFCFPSLYEGLGIVLIEAQATGMPCVVSDRIPDEAIATENVTKISLDESTKNWAEKIIEQKNHIRKNEEQDITKNGYNILQNVKQLEKIYNT